MASLLEFGANTFGQPETTTTLGAAVVGSTSTGDDWASGWGDFATPTQPAQNQTTQPTTGA